MESREREGERERGERERGKSVFVQREMRFDDEIVTESKRTKIHLAIPNERSSFRTVCGPD